MEHISSILFKKYEKLYLIRQKNKILEFARELHSIWELTESVFVDTYFNLFIKTKK